MSASAEGGRETILLVEDEQKILKFSQKDLAVRIRKVLNSEEGTVSFPATFNVSLPPTEHIGVNPPNSGLLPPRNSPVP